MLWVADGCQRGPPEQSSDPTLFRRPQHGEPRRHHGVPKLVDLLISLGQDLLNIRPTRGAARNSVPPEPLAFSQREIRTGCSTAARIGADGSTR